MGERAEEGGSPAGEAEERAEGLEVFPSDEVGRRPPALTLGVRRRAAAVAALDDGGGGARLAGGARVVQRRPPVGVRRERRQPDVDEAHAPVGGAEGGSVVERGAAARVGRF